MRRMTGKIIKGIAGFYYVHVVKAGVYECKAKGVFRKQNKKPLVGDNVEIDVVDEENKIGNIIALLPRRNELIRPAVANIDQMLLVFAVDHPKPNLNLLDRLLIMMERQNVPVCICFNKQETAQEAEAEYLKEVYAKCGYPVIFTSALKGQGMEQILSYIKGKTTAFAGPSGVGKSTVINYLYPEAAMETGAISEKIQRGRHTTRHSELFCMEEGTYLMDTPGFTAMFPPDFEKEDLKDYFNEFSEYEGRCRFQGCVHINEPGCIAKQALSEGQISKERYQSYLTIYEELKEQRRY